jgi:uncharacterized membrane protein YeaQ/YmgE (transglycosylase-associated protein family)
LLASAIEDNAMMPLRRTTEDGTLPDQPVDTAAPQMLVRQLLPLNGIILLGFMAIGLPLPVLPIFVHQTMTTSPLMAGLVVGLQSISTVLTRSHAGAFQDIAFGITGPVTGLIASMFGYQSVFAAGAVASLAGLALLIPMKNNTAC